MNTQAIPPVLKSLELPYPPKVFSYLSGLYSSQHHGKGLEFSELREYVIGDDIRSIDWRSSARGQKTYVKTYVDLRNQDVIFAVDGSASMVMSDDESSALFNAGTIISLIMKLALSSGDKVGFITTAGNSVFRSPLIGRRKLARSWYVKMYSHLYYNRQPSIDWQTFLENIRKNVTKRSLIIIVSNDFVVNPTLQIAYRRLCAMGHRIICLKTNGSLLSETAALQADTISDIETGELTDLSILDEAIWSEYFAEDSRRDATNKTSFSQMDIEYAAIHKPSDAVPELVRLLTAYQKRHHR